MNAMVMRLGPWRIERTLGRDLSGTYYAARHDDGVRATLYLLSGEVVAARREALTWLIRLHRDLSHASLVRFRELDHDGSDLYLIADAVDDTLASLRSRRPPAGQTRLMGATLSGALASAHRAGVVHGGLELDNVLWAPGRSPQILGTGVAALGITDHAALAHGDVAALGRLLCTLIAGRASLTAEGTGADGAADGRTIELVRLLADPGAAIAMRDAYALFADGEPTDAVRGSAGGVPDRGEVAPVIGVRGARAGAGSATAATRPLSEELADPGAAPLLDPSGASSDASESRGATSSAVGGAEPGEPRRPSSEQLGGYLGRYRILTRLGRGGMGEVLLAEDPTLRRGVAIKRIRPGLERDRTFRARLRREAQLAARLNHRAIVQVFDLITDDDADHVIMEYVPGPSLHTLTGNTPMPVSEAVRIAAEVADGLAYAHQQGVIHRDLKRENILIGPDGQPKIADFGIARRATSAHQVAEESLTREGFAVGTPRAMSPEQIQGHDIDARSDLFSFGVLLYELVTGASPFAAGNDAVTILRVLSDRQAPASSVVPDVPRELSDLIDQLLEKSPAQRPDSARTVRDRLRDLDAGLESRAASPAVRPSTEPGGRSRPLSTPATTPGTGERRQLTLVCIELVAAAEVDRALGDPELLSEVLPAFRTRVDDILSRFDGLLISALGHRFIACFGHPRPLEDAARRAVLAGRAMLDAAALLRSPDPAHGQVHFTASGAVHTGLAVARGRGAGQELVLGATLDTALRLLQLGRIGELWLSETAARLVESEFRLDDPAKLADGATLARRFVGATVADASVASGSGEHDRPMMGRDHEMQLLLGAWRRARQGQGQVALLIGEPGIGKSRLTRELTGAIAGDKPRRIVLRGSAYRQRSALEPAADAIAALLGVSPGGEATGGIAAAVERIRKLTGSDEAERVLHLLGQAPDPPAGPPARARSQLLGGLRDILIGTSHEGSTLIVVEDLHWLDPSTLDLIALIIEDVAASPLFLLMTTRPGLQPPWPASAAVTQLPLGRLEASAIEAVIAHACADRALSAAERSTIAARSEGVPLFAEELARAALELGRAGGVPSTLRDALTARLHQLGPAAISVAHVPAVAGREFTIDVIAAAGGLDRAAVEHELDRLVAVEILVRRRGRARDAMYQFSHVLLQQAAYEELLAGDRRRLHGQLADTLLADEHAGKDPGPELIAHHLAAARRFEEAIASAERAALRALARHARVEARELLRQALYWLDQLPASDARDRSEIGLRTQLGAVLISTEGYTSPELERSSRRTEILCERHDDMPLPVKWGLWAVRLMRGSPEEVEPLLGWFERVIDRGDPPIERMMAHCAIATYRYARVRYDLAGPHLERAMALFVPDEHASVVQRYGGCGGFYGHVISVGQLWHTGRLDEAWRHARAAVAQAEALDPYALTSALAYEMMLHVQVGDGARTEAIAERMLDIAARYEFPYMTWSALCHRGWALAQRGQAERAMADLLGATAATRQVGIKVWYPYFLVLLADSAIALGRFDDAERALDEALEVCRTSVDCSQEPELFRLRGRLIRRRDATAHAAARAAFTEALAMAERRGARVAALRAATDLAALLRDDDRPTEAVAVLGPVYRGFAPQLDDRNLATARQLLAELPAGAV